MSVVAARIKDMLAKQGMRTGGDVVEQLDKIVEELVTKAVMRAKENKRQTVYACDC